VLLRGKCKSCDAFIPVRLLFMEILTASLFVYVYLSSPSLLLLAFGLTLVSLLIVIAVYDMRHMVIPNEFVIAVFLCAVGYVGYQAYIASSLVSIIPHVLAGLGATLFYFLLWLVSKGRWIGFGDVKLAFPLGLMLLPFGAFSFVVFSFWIGAFLSILLMLIQKVLEKWKKHVSFLPIPLTMKSEVPFAPFMLIAFVVVFFLHADVLSIIAKLF
jgi:prepilin signal peptidase PulO-like enzyme (type II secretory pathway)